MAVISQGLSRHSQHSQHSRLVGPVFVAIWFVALWFMAGNAGADDVSRARGLAANCTTCHGSDGRSVGEVPPSLAGRDRAELLQTLLDYRAGQRASMIMEQHARGYSEAQLALIADWFARLPAGVARAAPRADGGSAGARQP